MCGNKANAPVLPGRNQDWWETCQEVLNRCARAIFFAYEPESEMLHLRLCGSPGEPYQTSIPLERVPALSEERLGKEEISKCLKELRRAALDPGRGFLEFRMRPPASSSASDSLRYRARWVSLADSLGRVYSVLGRAEEAERGEEDLRLRAERDAITGLYNRQTFEERIGLSLKAAPKDSYFVMFDIDDFKRVNDSRGHLAGDALLRRLGKLLMECAGESGLAGRVGGDEFALLLWESSPERMLEKLRALQRMAGDLQDSTDASEAISLSVGAYRVLSSDSHFEDVFEKADFALYQAKAEGKNCIRFYTRGGFSKREEGG